MKFLLDTCVLSEFVKQRPDSVVLEFIKARDESTLFVSSMTIAELHRGIQKLSEGKKKSSLLIWLADIEFQFGERILPFDHDCAIKWASICTQAEKSGKKISAFDSIIAAVAAKNNLVLVTRNVKDFKATGLEIINPWP